MLDTSLANIFKARPYIKRIKFFAIILSKISLGIFFCHSLSIFSLLIKSYFNILNSLDIYSLRTRQSQVMIKSYALHRRFGNPGEEYELTRHNAGRIAVLEFIKKRGWMSLFLTRS